MIQQKEIDNNDNLCRIHVGLYNASALSIVWANIYLTLIVIVIVFFLLDRLPGRQFAKKSVCFYYILNAISCAAHILLMTAEVNKSQFPKFSFQFIWHWSHNNTLKRKLFCRIPVFYNFLGP